MLGYSAIKESREREMSRKKKDLVCDRNKILLSAEKQDTMECHRMELFSLTVSDPVSLSHYSLRMERPFTGCSGRTVVGATYCGFTHTVK